MKTYLVTGGAGFIGSNFIMYMLNAHDDIRIINLDLLTYAGNLDNLNSVSDDERYVFVQGDICDAGLVSGLFGSYEIDYVVNFAAESHVDTSIVNPGIFVQTNVLGTTNLLSCAKNAWFLQGAWKRGVKFLQVSTDEVYGSLGPTGYFTETTPLNPHSPYSASKAGADLLAMAYADTFGMPVNITRCSNNYGPFQFPEKLIPLMILNAKQHKKLPVYGDGLNVRDWLHVEDHCRAIDAVLDSGAPGEVYNIGGHNERANIDVVRGIIALLNAYHDSSIDESLISYVEDRLGHDRRYGIDPAKMMDELGWSPTIGFEDGIDMTVQWYLNHQEWLSNLSKNAGD